MDSSFHLVRHLEFNKALKQLEHCNYDIREFLVLFPDFYSELQKGNNIFENTKVNVYSIEGFISEELKNRKVTDLEKERD